MKLQNFIFWAIGLGILVLSACKEDAGAKVKMGDFEFSQGNIPKALKRYQEAWKIDSTYPYLREKIQDMEKRKMNYSSPEP